MAEIEADRVKEELELEGLRRNEEGLRELFGKHSTYAKEARKEKAWQVNKKMSIWWR